MTDTSPVNTAFTSKKETHEIPDTWVSLPAAHDWILSRLVARGSNYVLEGWSARKYINARIDMRTGLMRLWPGNVNDEPTSPDETTAEPAGKPVAPDLWNAVSHLLSHWDEQRKCFELCGTTMTELRTAFAASRAPGSPEKASTLTSAAESMLAYNGYQPCPTCKRPKPFDSNCEHCSRKASDAHCPNVGKELCTCEHLSGYCDPTCPYCTQNG